MVIEKKDRVWSQTAGVVSQRLRVVGSSGIPLTDISVALYSNCMPSQVCGGF